MEFAFSIRPMRPNRFGPGSVQAGSAAAAWLPLMGVALAVGGCLRDLPDLPPVGEGAEVTGQAIALEPESGAEVPVLGALVRIAGTSRTALTDASGRFSISRLPLGTVLVVRSHNTRNCTYQPNGTDRLVGRSGENRYL